MTPYRTAREHTNLTQAAAARHLRISPEYLNRLEQGKSRARPSLDLLQAMCRLYGCTLDTLTTEESP